MKRLLLSLFTLTLILFTIDRLVGHALAARFRIAHGDEADAIGSGIAARAPIVICGSSRARHHYDPDSLAARLGLAAWNLGRDGQFDPYYPFGAAVLVLRQYHPRLWILEVDDRMISGPDQMSSLNVLLPYAGESRAVAELVNRRSRYERLKRLSAIYPYNSLVLALYGRTAGDESRRGFAPLEGALAPADTAAPAGPAREVEAPPLNPLKLRYLKAMVDSLEAHQVLVIAVRSPTYVRGPEDRSREHAEGLRLRAAMGALGVRFIDFSAEACPGLSAARLFHDRTHLDRDGADVLTAMLADSIATPGVR